MKTGLGNKTLMYYIRRDWQLLAIIALPILYFVIFCYLPMFGVVVAFKDYRVTRGFFKSDWVGLMWFKDFFTSIYCVRLIRNTLRISILNIILATPWPILFALLLDEIRVKWYKKISQTICYAPNFISTVVVVAIMYAFLTTDSYGPVNSIIYSLTGKTVTFIGSQSWFIPLFIVSGIWQSFGFTSILYMSALASVDPQMVEAIAIDGGNRYHVIRHVKLPSIVPTFVIMMILALGSVLSVGYEKIILMYSVGTYEVADVISTYVYRMGITQNSFGLASAVGLFNSIVSLFLIIVFNKIATKMQTTSLW